MDVEKLKENSYQVYKIICDETATNHELCYYGVTNNGLEVRFQQHLTASKQYERYKSLGDNRNMLSYSFRSREIFAKTNPRIELVRGWLSKEEAYKLESVLIEQMPCCNKALSRNIAGSAKNQYHRDKVTRPEKHAKRMRLTKEYRQNNRELIRQKLSRKIECEHGCGSTFQYRNKSQHMKSCVVLRAKKDKESK